MKVKKLETERTILRGFTTEDAAELYEYAKNPNVGPHAGWSPHKNIEESKSIIEDLFLKKYHCFAIVWKDTGKVIGSIGFEEDTKRPGIPCMELGYSLAEEYWGMGIMTEVTLVVLEYAFKKVKLDRISIYRNPENARSGRVIEKCGFIYEGTLRGANKIYDGSIRDVSCYSMSKKEYKKIRKEHQTSYAYLLRCADGSIYGGWTTDLHARLNAHNSGKGAKYTKSRLPVTLAYYETFQNVIDAMKREYQLKKMPKVEKEKFISEKKIPPFH